ncbi:MAG: YicC/YloC family endoribonuclease [Methyloceanibacter sp.]
MTLKSMTGFGRSVGVHSETSWHWEVRSVNGRNLELRFRSPSGLEVLEVKARSLCQEKLARGNCSLNLTLRRETGQLVIRLNEAALGQVLAVAERARGLTHMAAPSLDTLLAMRGVVEVVEGEESEDAQAKLEQALLVGLRSALDQLVAARAAEGARLTGVVANQLSQIVGLVERAANASARQPQAIAQRLAEQVGRLVETGAGLDAERLHQEALLLAAKADIQEELDRLRAHVAAANELLKHDEPVGRQLEFLAQEFNREANTLCSKASDIEISRAGLELKTVIDQLREQVQNIE